MLYLMTDRLIGGRFISLPIFVYLVILSFNDAYSFEYLLSLQDRIIKKMKNNKNGEYNFIMLKFYPPNVVNLIVLATI